MQILISSLLTILLVGSNQAKPNGLRMIHGESVEEHEFPFLVFVNRERDLHDNFHYQGICGGSLISTHHVLTAAHCVSNSTEDGIVVPKAVPSDLTVYLGAHDREQFDLATERSVRLVEQHEGYGRFKGYDIALLTMSEGVTVNEIIKPICLPRHRNFDDLDKLATIIGWGRANSTGKTTQFPHKMTSLIVGCYEEEGIIQTSVEKATTCMGDSGGPVVIQEGADQTLVGVVSGGESFMGDDCPVGEFVARFRRDNHTRVASYLDWIKEKVNDSGVEAKLCYSPVWI